MQDEYNKTLYKALRIFQKLMGEHFNGAIRYAIGRMNERNKQPRTYANVNHQVLPTANLAGAVYVTQSRPDVP